MISNNMYIRVCILYCEMNWMILIKANKICGNDTVQFLYIMLFLGSIEMDLFICKLYSGCVL